MSLPLDPVQFAMLSDTGFFGVSSDKLEEIAEEIRSGCSLFDAAWNCGIDPANLRSEDLSAIRSLAESDDEDE